MDMEDRKVLYSESSLPSSMVKIYFKKKENLKVIFRNLKYNKWANIVVGYYCQDCSKNILANEEHFQIGTKMLDNINEMKSKVFFI